MLDVRKRLALLLLVAVVQLCPLVPAQEENLLRNESFEEFTASGFVGWSCSQGSGASWKNVPLKPSADAQSGTHAAALPSPPAGQLLLFRQRIPAERIAHESTLRVTLWAKAFGSEQLQVVVAFKSEGEEKKVRAMHPGDGEWKELKMYFDLPRTADLGTVELQVLVRPGSDKPALVDKVRFWHEEIAPKYALPKDIQP